MAGSPVVAALAAKSRRRLQRVRAAVAVLAFVFLMPFFYVVAEWSRQPPVHPFALVAALGFGGPPLLALWRLRSGAAPLGLRLASALAVVAFLAAGLVLFLAFAPGSRALWLIAFAVAVAALAWVATRNATALRDEIGGASDWRASWGWAKLRLAVYYFFGMMVLGCGTLLTLKDPRNAREATAIGDLRTLASAQAAYRSANDGHYEGDLRCLSEPYAGCIPGYPTNAPTFLDPALSSLAPKSGYVRTFVAGPPPERRDPKRSSPTSVTSYSYSARPERHGESGYRSFLIDETGLVHFTREDRPATATDPLLE
jgi:hypothetical protein